MTYKELKERLNELTADQLNQEVKVMQEDIEISEEDYIYHKELPHNWCFLRSKLDCIEEDGRYAVELKAGTVFLYIE